MSTIDLDDQGRTGYFLPEDSQLRLKKLGEYVTFLANLARPRTSDENREWPVEIRVGEVAICLELLEEQIGLVLDELSWPAMLGDRLGARGDEKPVDVEDEAEELEAAEADDAEPEAMEAGDVEQEPTEECDSAGKRYVSGVTLDQIDELARLGDILRAHGDVVTATDQADFADVTLSIMGDAIIRDAERLQDIIRDIDCVQRLDGRRRSHAGVREEAGTYRALPVYLPLGGTAHIVREHPTYQ